MKWKRLFLPLAAIFAAAAVSVAASNPGVRAYSDEELKLITRLTSHLFAGKHYRHQPLTREMSQQVFDEYFDALDPQHLFFSEEDIRRFAGHRDQLAEELRRGEYSWAFSVYELFRRRHREFREFAEERLKQPFDFTTDESYVIDRSKQPRAATSEELRKQWELRLKNDVLYYRLFDRAVNEEAETDPEAKKTVESMKRWSGKTPEERVLRRLRDVGNDIDQREQVDILGIYLNTLAQSYGPHSSYYPPQLNEDFDIQMSLSLTGIGATLTSEDGFIKIVSLVPGGPAAVDGRLKVEDRIIAVTQEDGETVDVIDMPVSKAVRYIRGPVNSRVTLTVLPGEKGRNAVPENITITRAEVKLVDSEARGDIREVDNGSGGTTKIGVLTLPSFYMDFEGVASGRKDAKRCSADAARILKEFNEKGVEALVVDLRRNGGGSLAEAVELTGLFMPAGPVVQVRSADSRVETLADNDGVQLFTKPVVLLTSRLSASASEIFAAALRDCDRAIVVGDSSTFGKGTVLSVEQFNPRIRLFGTSFPAGSATYEMAMFFRPGGGSVQQLGIAPDIQLPSLTEELKIGEMYLDNHLPYDSIDPVPFQTFDSGLDEKIARLRDRSESRIAADPAYSRLLKRIEQLRRYNEKEAVSLNEEERWKEYQQEKLVSEETEKLMTDAADEDAGKAPDPVLAEAVNIAADFAGMK